MTCSGVSLWHPDHVSGNVDPDLLQGFYLNDLYVDPRSGKVSGRDGSMHLAPKAAEVLLVLGANAGELVTREDLIERVWGTDHGSDDALTRAISEIRHALADHHDQPRYVQTLPRRGYRLLVAPVARAGHTGSVVIDSQGRIDDIGLLDNLRQRGVLETAIAYLVLGWLLIQVADIVFAQLLLPAWTGTFVTVLVITGFPVAILLSWFLEIRDGRAMLHEPTPRDALKRRFGRTYTSIVGALAVAAFGVYLFDRIVGLPQAPDVVATNTETGVGLPPILDNSIAVLPFLNLDGSEQTQIFANGLVDDVITSLSRVPGLLVASRGDSFTLEPNSASAQVRERLRVARYVEGSVQIDGDTMRVVMQLIDSANGFHVLSRTFDRPVAQFFDMRDQVRDLTVANVRVALPPDTRSVPDVRAPDPSLDVYLLYRRGIEASREEKTLASVETALAWFDEALAIDPEFAAAHAGKCNVYVNGYEEADDPAFITSAEASCVRALSLNPNLDVVFTALGNLYQQTGRYARAEEAYLEALRLDAANIRALTGLGNTYLRLNRQAEAEESFRAATGLHPGDWSAFNSFGGYLYNSGRYAEAAEQYRKVVAVDAGNITGYSNLGAALMLAGNVIDAAPAYQRAIDIDPRPSTFSNLGLMYYYMGRYDDAISTHRKAVELAPQDYLAKSNLGDALLIAGQTVAAIDTFEQAGRLAASALAVNPADPHIMIDLAWIRAVLDRHGQARDLIDRALALAPDDPYVHYIDGLTRHRAGDEAGAISAFGRALENGYPVKLLAADPNLADLRPVAAFRDIIELAE